jgi:predicted NAD/FAD-binding protein
VALRADSPVSVSGAMSSAHAGENDDGPRLVHRPNLDLSEPAMHAVRSRSSSLPRASTGGTGRVAIVGGGAAGIGAAWALQASGRDVLLVEAAPRLGGNCLAATVPGADGREHAIDLGVSDFNRANFRMFARLIDELGLETQPISSDASFHSLEGEPLCHTRSGRWSFGKGFDDPEAFVHDLERFREAARHVLVDIRFMGWTVDRFLDHLRVSPSFRRVYVHARAMGCFPMPDRHPGTYSIRDLAKFWNIHGLLGPGPADRRMVVGGMHRYVRAFEARFLERGGELACGQRVSSIRRTRRSVDVHTVDPSGFTRRHRVSQVILAGNASEALAMLDAPSLHERCVLAGFTQQRARVVLHRDASVVGQDPDTFGAFNYVVPTDAGPDVRPTITFFPNRLASLPAEVPDVFVSMNPATEPYPETVLLERHFSHPIASAANRAATMELRNLQGHARTFYAGSHLNPPFVHESALVSGIRAAELLLHSEVRGRAPLLAG